MKLFWTKLRVLLTLELNMITFIGMYPITHPPFLNNVYYLNKIPMDLRLIERSGFMKEVKNQKLRNVDLGSQESMIVPIWFIIGFQ